MKPTAYIETSVVSYLTARPARDMVVAAYQEITRDWWRNAPNRFDLVASQLVIAEAGSGDPDVAKIRLKMLKGATLLDATPKAENLAQTLVDLGAVPRQAAEDAAHIAIAATNGIDFLVTWNFRHIANASMRARIEHTCRQAGYEPPVICTPNELMELSTQPTDPIISEVRSVRDAHASRFRYDLSAIFRNIRAMQDESGRKYVCLPSRPVASSGIKPQRRGKRVSES